MTNTQPETANAALIAAVEAGWEAAEYDSLAANSEWGHHGIDSAITAGRAAFRELVTALAEREKALTDRIIVLEDMIEECCSLRDVMNYPDGERILNVVRSHVLARALLASLPADGESEGDDATNR